MSKIKAEYYTLLFKKEVSMDTVKILEVKENVFKENEVNATTVREEFKAKKNS